MDDSIKWQELRREQAWVDPFGRRRIDKVTYRLPNGEETDYYLKMEASSSVIVAMTKDQQFILARQYRPGKDQIILELPGGGIKPGQTPEEAARAELLEETGYTGTFQFIAESLPDAYSTRRSNIFVATDCEKVANQRLDPHEFVEIVLVPLDAFKAHARSAQLTDADAAMLGLDYLKLL